MYNSNQVVKSFEYEFEIHISKVFLKTKFPCQFYTSLKYRPQLPQLVSPEVVSIDGKVEFNHTHRFTLFINQKQDSNDSKKLAVGLRSKHRPLEKIIAGFVTIDLLNYTQYSHPPKIFKIQRCPDQEGLIEIGIKSHKIRQSLKIENEPKSISKLRCYKSQIFTELKPKEQPITKRSCINQSLNQEQFYENTNISGSFSKLINIRKQSGNVFKLLTPDKQGHCQLSFAKMKQSCVSRSLNYDEVRQSIDVDVEMFPTQVSNFRTDNMNLQQKNKQLSLKLIQTQQQRASQQAYIKLLQQQLANSKSKFQNQITVSKIQRSSTQCSTYNNIFTQKQISAITSGDTINILQKQPSHIDINLLERNTNLLKTLGNLRQDLQTPIKQIQQILHNQIEFYQEQSSWNALKLLEKITQKLNLIQNM